MAKVTREEFGELLKKAVNQGLERGKALGIDPTRDMGEQDIALFDENESYVERKVANIFDEDDDEALIKCVVRLRGEETPYTDAEIIEEFEKFFKNELKERSPREALIWANKVINTREK